MAETIRYAIIMLAAGIGIPLLAALNAQLGGRIGAPAAAASLLFAVAFLGATLVMVLTGSTRALAAIPRSPGTCGSRAFLSPSTCWPSHGSRRGSGWETRSSSC